MDSKKLWDAEFARWNRENICDDGWCVRVTNTDGASFFFDSVRLRG